MPTERYPCEISGHPIDVNTTAAVRDRKRKWCPFRETKCNKRGRLVKTFNVCSAKYDGHTIALCPKRFLEDKRVFRDIARAEFGSAHDVLVFSEVTMKGIGSCDFVLAKHEPLGETILDFTIVEFQGGQTTNTGKLVQGYKDAIRGKKLTGQHYGFGLNLYDIWKREFTQMLFKGLVAERWKKRIYWVAQPLTYEYLVEKYKLDAISEGRKYRTVFALYDLKRRGNAYRLTKTGFKSTHVNSLFRALRHNQSIPDMKGFTESLHRKMAKGSYLRLRLAAG